MNIAEPFKIVQDKLQQWLVMFIEMLPNLAIGLIVLLIFYLFARLARRLATRFGDKLVAAPSAARLVGNIAFTVVFLSGFFVVLEILQLSKAVTSLLAGAGILGLALSFAFQDMASNFVSGIMIMSRRPYQVGDIVESNGFFGKVKAINLRNTILETFQGQNVLIPNQQVFQNPVSNYTETGARRIDLSCGVSYGDDLQKVSDVALAAIKQVDEVMEDRDISFMFEEFGGSSVNFKVRFWVRYDKQGTDYVPALNDAIIKLKQAFDENDIMIPYPIRTLDFGIRGGVKLSEELAEQQSAGK